MEFVFGNCCCDSEPPLDCCTTESGTPINAGISFGPCGTIEDIISTGKYTSLGDEDVLVNTVFGSGGSSVTPPINSTTLRGTGVTISGVTTAETIGDTISVDLSFDDTFLYDASSSGPITVEFDSKRKVCYAQFGLGANNYGSYDVTLEAWDSGGNYVSVSSSISNTIFSGSCSNTWMQATAAYEKSLTKMRYTITSGTPGGIGIGSIILCTVPA